MAGHAAGDATRASLLIRLREPGDREAWGTFVRVYGPLIIGYARRDLQDADAEDIGQEVLTKVARLIRDFDYDPGKGRFRDWLGRVTSRTIAHHLKRPARPALATDIGDDSPLEVAEGPGPDERWETAFKATVLREALANIRPHFKEKTWQAFVLVWLENRPAAEVAAEMGESLDWVYVAKSRVLERLHDEVQFLAEDSILSLY